MVVRVADNRDIPNMTIIRNSVKENVLSDPGLITKNDYEIFIGSRGKGWVCEIDGITRGFAIVDLKERNVWALFVLPGFERMGIGRKLHATMLDWFFSQSEEAIWLSTSPGTRAEAFYRKAGWKEIGLHGKMELKFEMNAADWKKSAFQIE